MSTRKMRLGAFLHGVGHHVAGWRHQSSRPDLLVNVRHYLDMARTAERGRFDLIFFADNLSVRERDPAPLRHIADYIVQFEPIGLLSALSVVTERIGLISTASTSYNEPYHVARKFASLDHLSNGRAGWNLVTSTTEAEAHNFGRDSHFSHGDRYARAAEFAEVVRGLWDSWEDDAFPRDQREGIYCDPDKLHVLNHKGVHFRVRGPLNVARPPQGHPVIAQAGASPPGRDLAARTADLIYSMQWSLEAGQEFYADMKARAERYGRAPDDVKIMPGMLPVVGRTEAEAQEKFEQMQSLVDPVVGISQLSAMFGGIDLSNCPIDGPLPDLPETNASKTRQDILVDMAKRENLTIRQLYLRVAGARSHWMVVGSPQHVADQLEHRFNNGAADGYNVMPATLPGGLDDFVQLVIPELQRRGLFRREYEGHTLRENLGLPRPAHPATMTVHSQRASALQLAGATA